MFEHFDTNLHIAYYCPDCREYWFRGVPFSKRRCRCGVKERVVTAPKNLLCKVYDRMVTLLVFLLVAEIASTVLLFVLLNFNSQALFMLNYLFWFSMLVIIPALGTAAIVVFVIHFILVSTAIYNKLEGSQSS